MKTEMTMIELAEELDRYLDNFSALTEVGEIRQRIATSSLSREGKYALLHFMNNFSGLLVRDVQLELEEFIQDE